MVSVIQVSNHRPSDLQSNLQTTQPQKACDIL